MLQILCSVRSTPALIPQSVLFDFGIGNITKEVTRRKVKRMCKVHWNHHSMNEATCEREDELIAEFS